MDTETLAPEIDHERPAMDPTAEVVDRGGPSELERHKQARGYTPPPPTPSPDATGDAGAEDVEAKPEPKKPEAWVDPDTGDRYDMRHKVARRIKKVLEERAQERAEKDRLLAELDAMHARVLERDAPKPAPAQARAVDADGEPDPSDTQKYPEGQYDRAYLKDQARWEAKAVVRAELEQARAQAQQQQTRTAEAQTIKAWQESLPEATKRYPDFEKALEAIPNTPQTAPISRLMMSSPVGNDVVYAIGSNPELLDAYHRAPSDEHRLRLLYHLEAQAIAAQRAASTTTPKTTTRAPMPITPVHAGQGPAQSIDWTKDDPDQLQRWKSMRRAR